MSEQKNIKPPKTGKGPKFNPLWVYAIIMIGITAWYFMGDTVKPVVTSWDSVETLISSGDVERVVVVNDKQARIFIKKDSLAEVKKCPEFAKIPDEAPQIYFVIGSLQAFQTDFKNATVQYHQVVPLLFSDKDDFWSKFFWSVFPIVLLIAVWIIVMRKMSGSGSGGGGSSGGMFNVGKAKAQVYDKDAKVNITFKDVAGLEEAKVEIMEIVDFLKKPEKYKDLGGKIPKGALLVGPPGTGKTLLAKAVAGEADVPFLSISGSDFVEMFVGVGASRVRDLFRQAKDKAPCIVFIDEIDAIGRARGRNAGYSSNDERENTLNQLLTEMDGFGTNAGVIILAATNRADILDKALMRAGRFDRQIEVGLPDIKERREIFDVHLKPIKLEPDIDREFLAKQTPGFSGADIANVCNEAALIAARHNKPAVQRQDFLSAIDRIVGGLERRNTIITKEEKRKIAYHEAGHATVSWMLEHAHPLIKVTIIPRGSALGAAWYLPDERKITSQEQMMDELAATLGGRASEQLTFESISTGALSDLEIATKRAYAMVAYYGMSEKVGNISFYDSSGQSDMALTKPYSETTAQSIDSEAKAVLDKAYKLAIKTLEENKEGLRQVAELLLEREVIFTEDVEKILGKRKRDIDREKQEAQEKIEKESDEQTAQ